MTEALLQNYLIKTAKAHNVYARKLVAVGNTGFPDVMIAVNGHAVFVELKNPNGKGRLSKKQIREINKMKAAGLSVILIQSRKEVDDVIKQITSA